MFKKLLVNLLFRGVRIHSLRVKRLRVGNTIEITDDYIDMQPLTSDPPLAEGRMWYRSDQNLIKYSDGSSVKDLRGVPVVISPTAGYGVAGKGSVWTTSSTWEEHDCSWRDIEIDLGIGSARFAFWEKVYADNQEHAFHLRNNTDNVSVVYHYSNSEPAGEYYHIINFTAPSGVKRYEFVLFSDGSNYYSAGKHSIISATPLENLYLVELVEVSVRYRVGEEEVERTFYAPALVEKKVSLTYGVHAYDRERRYAIIQIMNRVDPAKLDIIRPVSYRELKEFQRKWKYL